MKTFYSVKLLIVLILFTEIRNLTGQTHWSKGPMLHVNFGDEKIRASRALEFAYWNFNAFPYSIDFAAEFERKKVRLYSEAQTGVGFAGIAAGPVLEFQTETNKIRLGFQSSAWANYFWGVNFRIRFIDRKTILSPGSYFKIPFNGHDENGNKITGSSNSHQHNWD